MDQEDEEYTQVATDYSWKGWTTLGIWVLVQILPWAIVGFLIGYLIIR